jgi:two-component system OmpR family response regulator
MTAPSPLTSTAAPADRAALRGPDGRPIRVLVVDDEQALSELVSLALRYEGWEVRSAADGMSAIAAARDFRPDLVVLDVMLPDIDGLEVLRRSHLALTTDSSTIVVGDLMLDEDAREVRRGDDLISLTATEFELLRFLMRNPKRVMSKAQILDRVWNYDFGGQANIVELYISYLRKKIDAGREPMIHTMRGFGYVLKPAT